MSPTLVNGFHLEVSGKSIDQFLDTIDTADTISNNAGTTVVVGSGPTASPASAGGGAFGGFADLTRGLIGSYSVGVGNESPGALQTSTTTMVLNLTFSGTGSFSPGMLLTYLAGPGNGGAFLSAAIEASPYHLDNGVVGDVPNARNQFSTTQLCDGFQVSSGCPDGLDGTPIDLSLSLPVDAIHNYYQLLFQMSTFTSGTAFVNAASTADLSLTLSPGVTVDLSQNFLSLPQSPEPNYFGSQVAAPEPSALGFALPAITLLIACIARRSKRQCAATA
ncbi:MAG TPA: hypothetical protein VKT81_14935 [Bryobacteraceae bacterium]|nr:hypothetical protein [Bryobacteraceae bacterium]